MPVADKAVVYTAIPKFLVYADPIIGAFVENEGYAVSTPWQYDYGMGDRVPYESLKESLNSLAVNADEVWVFGAPEGTFPNHEDAVEHGIGLTDGCIREVELARQHGVPVRYYEVQPESLDITRADT